MNNFYSSKQKRIFNFNITFFLIVINLAIFLLFSLAKYFFPDLLKYLGLMPSLFLQGVYPWTLLTSMFMHGSFMHLFFNMLSLFYVGNLVEKIVGKKRYLGIYIISGLLANIFFVLCAGFLSVGIFRNIFGSADIIGVGASGAIFGLIGVLAVLIPKKKIYLIIGPLLAIVVQSIIDSLLINSFLSMIFGFLINLYFFICIFAMFSFNTKIRRIVIPLELQFWFVPLVAIIPLVLIGIFVELPIGNSAHFGGLLIGIIYGLYLKRKYKNKTKNLVRYV